MKNNTFYLFILLLKICFTLSQQALTLQQQSCDNVTNTINEVSINFLNLKKPLDYKNYPILPDLKLLGLNYVNVDESGSYPNILFQPKIEKIRIYNSNYTVFNKEIESLQNLKILQIKTCKLKNFPYQLQNLKNLEEFELSFNHLKDFMNIPPNLESLELENAEVGSIDIDILKDLTYLGLRSNPIKNIDNMFEEITNKLPKLTELNLSKDTVSVIPKSIKNLTNLKSLNLEENKIMVIPDELYSLSLDTVHLKGNPNLMGSFKFNHVEDCTIENSNICFQNESENKLIIISLIIAIVLLLIFIIYFFFYNKNKNQPIFIKDENNATYAYTNNEKSREYINELNVSNSDIKEKELKADDSLIEKRNISNNYEKNLNENNSYISQPEQAYITNLNGNNNMNNNVIINSQLSPQLSAQLSPQLNSQLNPQLSAQLSSQLSPQLSPQLNGNGNINSNSQLNSQFVGNINGSIMVPQLSHQLINNSGISNLNQPLNPPLINNITGTSFIPQLSPQISGNNSNSNGNPELGIQSLNNGIDQLNNSNLTNMSLMASSSNQSNNMNSTNNLDIDQVRLQAKIQKEMLLAEEMLINKKAKDNSKKDNNDDQLPPYSQL
ncbi:hypothetical protein H8356DRAFT_1267900 [Neocallimastix lanati (nom. inval.)]|nr:hypothetical protein H8356DRAFT_1267900 [Neocallimastix sp. JGI-2020a]